MKAAVHTRYGPPEVVTVRDIPQPVPGEGEVLVRVHATTVNRTDDATRSATPPVARLVTGFFSGLGADRCIDYTTEDFTADDERYDLVYDAVGKVTFGRCKPLLKDGGCFVSSELGPWAQNAFLAIAGRFTKGTRVLFAFPKHDRTMMEYFADLLASGDFRPLIDRHYPLDDIVEVRPVGSKPRPR